MTIEEAIEKTDAMKPNSYTDAEKAVWLSELDGDTEEELREWYEDAENVNEAWFSWRDDGGELPYVYVTEQGEESGSWNAPCLLIPFPHDVLYLTWLGMKIDFANGDIARYNNGKILFDEQYGAFKNRANRTLLHKTRGINWFGYRRSAAPAGGVRPAPKPIVKVGYVTLGTTWSGSDPYTQTVTVTGAVPTARSKVDIQPGATALSQMETDGITALYIENNAGTLTATALGGTLSEEITVQVTLTEV